MSKTTVERILEQVDGVAEGRTKLYFIVRSMKSDVKKKAKVLDKYQFKTYQVDVDDDIRKELYGTAKQSITDLVQKEKEFHPFNVINDGQHTLLTYSMTNKVMSFKAVVEEQLPNQPTRIQSLAEIVGYEEIWAYVIGMYTAEGKWIYAFRKILKSKVAVDLKENAEKSVLKRALRTYFNTTSQKLELIEGETVVLDKQIDCFYFEDSFYVHRQTQFEQIVGLEEEYHEQAKQVVTDLEASELFIGIEILKVSLADKPMHKRLVRLTELGLYQRVDSKALKKMSQIAKREGLVLKVEDGKFKLEDQSDVALVIKMLCAYFKKDEVFGESYGTFSGKKLEKVAQT
mgnify:CR=1 FL=1